MAIDVLDHMWWEDMEACLVGRIPRGTPICADALAQHDRVAQRLGFVLKTLVTAEGQIVRTKGVFHLQHVNAHHSTLKGRVNNWFKGVASKYLYRYVGWRRALSTCDLTLYRLIEKLAGEVGCINYKAEQSLTKLLGIVQFEIGGSHYQKVRYPPFICTFAMGTFSV